VRTVDQGLFWLPVEQNHLKLTDSLCVDYVMYISIEGGMLHFRTLGASRLRKL
jgi:hypothetical protein